jgi:hypothetical protein
MSVRQGGPIEGGWLLVGEAEDGSVIRLVIGESELAQTYLGLTVGRHPALCHRVIADGSVSRRHLRFALARGELLVEDLNSLNGTLLDGQPLATFQPQEVSAGQSLAIGKINLHVSRLEEG